MVVAGFGHGQRAGRRPSSEGAKTQRMTGKKILYWKLRGGFRCFRALGHRGLVPKTSVATRRYIPSFSSLRVFCVEGFLASLVTLSVRSSPTRQIKHCSRAEGCVFRAQPAYRGCNFFDATEAPIGIFCSM